VKHSVKVPVPPEPWGALVRTLATAGVSPLRWLGNASGSTGRPLRTLPPGPVARAAPTVLLQHLDDDAA
jgi:hypothetical protein